MLNQPTRRQALAAGSILAVTPFVHSAQPAKPNDRLKQSVCRWCYGKTPLQTFLDGAPVAREKMLDGIQERLA